MKKITLFIIAIFSSSLLIGQTADVTLGCDPLQVAFTSPGGLASHYWEFGDGNFSENENPSHNYTLPGDYTVELFEGSGGTKVGEIIITVLAPPDIQISASEQSGCSPFQVDFTNESIVDPDAQITGYFWDFGDGGNSTQENPTYTYSNEGTYSVSLKIISALENCEITKSFENFISVSGNVNANFSVANIICTAPASFDIINFSTNEPGYTYTWDFGNGETSTEYNPPPAEYANEGLYTITMVVDNGEGCVVTISKEVKVGKPEIEINVPDTLCIGLPYTLSNLTQANVFSWTFGANAQPQSTNLRSPTVTFNTAGPQIVTFSAIATSTCQADTFFTIFVEDPNAAFTIDPLFICTDPATYTFTHPVSNLKRYEWYVRELDTTVLGGPQFDFTYDEPFRDSFYISRLDTFNVLLNIETNAGCRAIDSTQFYHRAPRAHFVPNITRGCAPLTVNFDEVSESIENIISWDWTFGDGQDASTNTADDMSHIYTDPGEYYVQLIIENDAGCRDTSEGVWIYVGELIDSDFTFDQTDICLNDTVNFEALNLDPRIDAYHFDTDGGRISHCHESTDASHAFVHAPGTYPVTLTLEYNGCFNQMNNGETITVNGSKSRIKFMTNCIDPYTVMFQDSSINATTSIWYINGDTINMDTIVGDVFNYTFDDTGDYVVKLWTDDDTMCDPDSSDVNIYIRDIEANFDLPEKICASAPYDLDASLSVDVDNTCSKGYEWFGIANRPRMVDYPNVQGAWAAGSVTVRLIVEDLNGCKDTLDNTAEAFDVHADFEASKDKICFPSTMSFMDLSVGDTTLVDWQWSFGSTQQNPMDELFVDNPGPFLPIELIVKDVLGCVDTALINIPVFEPFSNVSLSPSNVVCLGDSIDFSATDFTQEGSFLNFNWSFGAMGSSMEQNPSISVTEPGITPVSLIIREDSTGCTNEYSLNIQGIIPPTADFSIDVDNPDRICPDEIVEFINNSTLDGPGGYLWDFGNGSTAFGESPSTFFDVGTFDIMLTVSSIYGCSDTHTEQIFLEGPEGDFTIDKNELCIGDTVTFELIDQLDVVNFIWDFGDGNTLPNVNPTAHPYTFLPDTVIGNLGVSIILESQNGCTKTVTNAIQLSDLRANFGIILDTINICDKEIQFIDSSAGFVNTYTWDFGDGQTSNEQDPVHTYSESGKYDIILTIQSDGEICQSSATDTFTHTALEMIDVPNVFSPNDDGINDFFDIIIREDQRECVEVVKSKIFNRWGNMIYDNDLPPEGWDGKFENGDDAPAEVYTYILEVVYFSGETEPRKGRFTLIR